MNSLPQSMIGLKNTPSGDLITCFFKKNPYFFQRKRLLPFQALRDSGGPAFTGCKHQFFISKYNRLYQQDAL
jgi:hypothetical protein